MIKWEKALLDADFSFKLGQLTNMNVIEDYVGELVGTIYMHRHIYEREILTPRSVKEQIDRLITKGKAEIVDLSTLPSPLEKSLYHEMVTLLKAADAETKELGKNWGETVSLAYAKVSGIPYFLSDEKSLQALADEYLNTDAQHSITIIRLKDFMRVLVIIVLLTILYKILYILNVVNPHFSDATPKRRKQNNRYIGTDNLIM